MVVLGVALEVFGEIADAAAEQRNLHFRRPGIVLGLLVLAYNLGFFGSRN